MDTVDCDSLLPLRRKVSPYIVALRKHLCRVRLVGEESAREDVGGSVLELETERRLG